MTTIRYGYTREILPPSKYGILLAFKLKAGVTLTEIARATGMNEDWVWQVTKDLRMKNLVIRKLDRWRLTAKGQEFLKLANELVEIETKMRGLAAEP